jgi:hypothetical protein
MVRECRVEVGRILNIIKRREKKEKHKWANCPTDPNWVTMKNANRPIVCLASNKLEETRLGQLPRGPHLGHQRSGNNRPTA